jgi:hypothetical protein
MTTAVHPGRLARRESRSRVWRVTAAVLLSVAIGAAGGIAIGNALAAHEPASVAPTAIEQVTQFSSHSKPHGEAGRPAPSNEAMARPASIGNG